MKRAEGLLHYPADLELAEQLASGDAGAILDTIAEQQLNDEEARRVLVGALLYIGGAIGAYGPNGYKARLGAVIEARQARRRHEEESSREVRELAAIARDTAEALGLGATS